jgi:hypothetical protein
LQKVVEVGLPNRELDALIVEGAANFHALCAVIELSYSAIAFHLCLPERRSVWRGSKGHVTRHPLLSAIEYQIEVNAKCTPPTPDELSRRYSVDITEGR